MYKKKKENPTSSDLTHHGTSTQDSQYLDLLNSSGPWNCEFCSFRNRSQDEICQKCYAESFKLRYKEFMNIVDGNNLQNEQGSEQKKKLMKQREPVNAENDNRPKWKCSICTFMNTGDG